MRNRFIILCMFLSFLGFYSNAFAQPPLENLDLRYLKLDGLNQSSWIPATSLVTNLNADLWDGYQFIDYLDQPVKTDSEVIFSYITSTWGMYIPEGDVTISQGNITISEGGISCSSTGNVSRVIQGINTHTGGNYSEGVYGLALGAESWITAGVHGESPSGRGVYGESRDGTGVYGKSINGHAIVADSTNGPGISITAGNGTGIWTLAHGDNLAGRFRARPYSNNTVVPIVKIERGSEQESGRVGIGAALDFGLFSYLGGPYNAGRIACLYTGLSVNGGTSALTFSTSSTEEIIEEKMRITGDGKVGIGIINPNSKLHVNGSIATAVATKTSNYTITESDGVVICNPSTSDITITLPTASGITGRRYTIKNISSYNVIIDGDGVEIIDGALMKTLASQYACIVVISDGSSWIIESQIGTVN